MENERFEVVLINDGEAFEAKEAKVAPCTNDICKWVDYCSGGCQGDVCGVDFTG